jgi:hypothetical protein
MKKLPSKEQRIFRYLKKGSMITQRIAIRKFHHYRLAVVINRIRNAGYYIETLMCSENGCIFAEYRMHPDK